MIDILDIAYYVESYRSYYVKKASKEYKDAQLAPILEWGAGVDAAMDLSTFLANIELSMVAQWRYSRYLEDYGDLLNPALLLEELKFELFYTIYGDF